MILFYLILSAFLEIVGCRQYYQYFINHKPVRYLITGTLTLMAFGRACAQPSLPHPSYIYAAYAGIYAAVAILFGMPVIDKEALSINIVLGAGCYLLGSLIMLWPYLRA